MFVLNPTPALPVHGEGVSGKSPLVRGDLGGAEFLLQLKLLFYKPLEPNLASLELL